MDQVSPFKDRLQKDIRNAVRKKNPRKLKILLDKNTAMLTTAHHLNQACYNGDLECAKLLAEKTKECLDDHSAKYAAASGNEELLKYIIATRHSKLEDVLYSAVEQNHFAIITNLVKLVDIPPMFKGFVPRGIIVGLLREAKSKEVRELLIDVFLSRWWWFREGVKDILPKELIVLILESLG